MEGHTDEIFSCAFNYEGDTIITGSKDNTCKVWKDNVSKDKEPTATKNKWNCKYTINNGIKYVIF